nr:hypothetical protein [Tanacetum cinerariifolium]
MSSDSHATITYTSMSSYEAPPSPDYIPGPEAPPSPDYIPGPEYPEYLPPADDVLLAKEQPLPTAEEDGDDKKFEEDSIDYPTSRGDDDADDDGDDLSEDDADNEDEEESSDSEEEEEEHLALTVPALALHSFISASEDSDETEPFEEGKTTATPPPFGYHVAARISVRPHIPMPFHSESEVERLLAIPTPPLSPVSPTSYPLPPILMPLPIFTPLPPPPIILPRTRASMVLMRSVTPSTLNGSNGLDLVSIPLAQCNQPKDFCKEREQYFEIQDLKAQLQDKSIAISELKKLIEKLKGKSVVVMSADSAVTFSSVHSEARSWSIPSEDPYEEAAQQLFEQVPHPPKYVPRDHVPVFFPKFKHFEDLMPAEGETPTSLLPPGFLSPHIRPLSSKALVAEMNAIASSLHRSLHQSGTPPLLPISTPSTSRRARIPEAIHRLGISHYLLTLDLGSVIKWRFTLESSEFCMRHHDTQKDHAAIRAEIEVLRNERLAYEQEGIQTREALARSEAHYRALEARVAVLETHARRLEWQRQAAHDFAVEHIMHTQALEARARDDTLEDTASNEELKEPMEDQPLPADASPTALSPGYVVDFDPEKDEKDPKEDPADYLADKGNNDEDESSNDDDDDDDVEKDE